MPTDTRQIRIIAAVACPLCGAGAGERCRNPIPHQTHRGPQDRRPQPIRVHAERRRAWQQKRDALECR